MNTIRERIQMMNKTTLLLTLSLLATSVAKAEGEAADSIPFHEDMADVVVTGCREATDTRHLPFTVSVLTREQFTARHRTAIMPSLMQQVPGLMVTSRGMMGYGVSGGGSGGMMLRGISSGSGQMMVLVDGHPQYNGIYGHSVADAYHTLMAERVEVLRGPASLLYGSNAMGGVVNIVTRGMQTDGVRTRVTAGAGSYGTVQAEASNQLRLGRWHSTVGVQYGRSDNHRPHMGFEQTGAFAKAGFDLSPHWLLYADVDISHYSASNPGTVGQPMLEADQWITRGVAALGIDNHYAHTSGRLSVYDNFGKHKINDGYAQQGGTPQARLFRSRDALAGVSWFQNANLWTGGRLTLGADYQRIYGHAWYTSRATGEVLNTPNKQSGKAKNNEGAVYADVRQDVASWLTLDAGVRWDYHTVTGSQWIPQGGLVVRPVATGELKASVGKGFRNPTMREMYLYPPSNEDLRPERLISYELSWRQRLLGGALTYGANVFYIDADNIIQTINRRNVNTGRLKNAGVEGELQWRAGSHWTLSTNHAWLHMKNPVVAAPVYKGYLGVQMRYGRWALLADLQQVCGLYTAVGQQERQEHFTLLDAQLQYALSPMVHLWVRGDNLLAQRYEINAGFPMPKATFMAGFDVEF